ncbi:phage tail protein [Pseudomonas alliivorans]|uniref:phage tail protein n=1 Tax=Pseudomonas alliivorans TaxID=2810613 RepID=UPI001AE33F98|nr:phage tail protein [Pseudomonas alliivorans]MBP0943083.1 phage tail protein [Pseudomonas alliivorans]MEE4881179.1 phage tail protein [Pseudomonas alliivorans]MEE4932483.1 phage tail protein [Pseudomonas alliivorans]MEE4937946.1 phage tail protein [Pseudomonas alliivorans]MEE4943121.1 phage tail protein [Pseudomonas alliivorans]
MAIETFSWPTQHGDAPDISYRVRSSQFGDGYKQQVGDGLNNKLDAYPITFTGLQETVTEIMDFFDRHAGAKAFLWTTPLGQLGLFTCNNPVPVPVGGRVFKLTATFERAFHP